MPNIAPTLKNTKAELLDAFEKMKEEYAKAKQQQAPLNLAQHQEEEELLTKTVAYTPANLDEELKNLRKTIDSSLEELTEKITEESKKLFEIRQVIAVESQKLKTTRNVELSAAALETIIFEYEQKSKELTEKKRAAEEALTREIAQRQMTWEREQEEYTYNLKVTRKKEEDEYKIQETKKKTQWQEEMNKKETELAEKEHVISARQEEISRLEAETKNYPQKLEQAIEETKKQIATELTKEYTMEKRLAEQERLGETNMLEAKINGLLENVKNQTKEIESLKTALANANQQAQNLAATVIEGMAGMKQAALTQPKNADII